MTIGPKDKAEKIKEICKVISFYAERLPWMRNGSQTNEVRARRYLASDKKGRAYQTISPWYLVLEPLYAEFEAMISEFDEDEAAVLLADESVRALLGRLYQIRAAYEFDKEMEAASSLLTSDEAMDGLRAILDHQSYWTLIEPVLRALQHARCIAVIGSGPLPLTPLALVQNTKADITCFESDRAAFEVGKKILALYPHQNRIECRYQQAQPSVSFAGFDAVLSAVLLGVSATSSQHIPKSETLNDVLSTMPQGAIVILRDPYRLGTLLYPPLDTSRLVRTSVERFDPTFEPGEPYRSSFLMLRRNR